MLRCGAEDLRSIFGGFKEFLLLSSTPEVSWILWQIVFLLALFLEVADGVGDSNEEVVGLSAEDCGEM